MNLNKFSEDIVTRFEAMRSSISTDAARNRLVAGVQRNLQNTRNLRDVSVDVGAKLASIDKLGKGIKQQFQPLKMMAPVDIEAVRRWVTVKMIADYASTGLCDNDTKPIKTMTADDLGDVNFGEAFAKFLYSDEIQILQLRRKSGTSASIYQTGRIPWAGGRPYDKIGLMLFLEWFQRNINPFDLIRPNVKEDQFKNQIKIYIRNLGTAMSASKKATWGGMGSETISSLQDVNTALDSRRGRR